jgi:tRNA nucleotidyltransferase/poly(A) polymerase
VAQFSAVDGEKRLVTELRPPSALLEIAETLARAGHDVWAVGGAVRDALLGRTHADWDLATDARPADVRRIFKRTIPIGIEHGTVGVLGRDRVLYEVTTFRRDVETTGRHAVVEFANTIEEDLARRDFTINAIAWHPIRHELLDPFGGIDDLRDGVLRTVGIAADRFAEDYLRVLRALRFAGHFELRIELYTWNALRAAVAELNVLSAERVREELWKVLRNTRAAARALHLYSASGVLQKLFPELAATVGLEIDDHVVVWERTLRAVDAVAPRRVLLRVAALFHAIGHPPARTRDLRGNWRYTGHEQWAARKAEAVMRRLKASNADRERVVSLVRHQADLFPPDAPHAGVRRWLLHITPELVYDLFRLRIALWRAAPVARGELDLVERWRHAHAILLEHPVLSVAGLAIDGNDLRELGIPPGPEYGRILGDLLERVVEEPRLNTPEQLLDLVRTGEVS